MSVSNAQKRATAKFESKNYDKILIRLKKGDKKKIQEYATTHNESINGFIRRAIQETMEKNP